MARNWQACHGPDNTGLVVQDVPSLSTAAEVMAAKCSWSGGRGRRWCSAKALAACYPPAPCTAPSARPGALFYVIMEAPSSYSRGLGPAHADDDALSADHLEAAAPTCASLSSAARPLLAPFEHATSVGVRHPSYSQGSFAGGVPPPSAITTRQECCSPPSRAVEGGRPDHHPKPLCPYRAVAGPGARGTCCRQPGRL